MEIRQWRIVGVCGYGCNLDSPLKPYLDKVAQFCRQWRPDIIILSGGPTQQKSFPDTTEARVMYEHLLGALGDVLHDWWIPVWYLNEDAYTTYDNIGGIAERIYHWKAFYRVPDGEPEVVLFCEATRALKIARAARWFLGFPPAAGGPSIRIETDSWELMHPTWELISTIEMELSLRFPLINWFRRRQRIKKSKTR